MRTAIAIPMLIIANTATAASWPFDEAPYAYIGAELQIKSTNSGYSTFCNGSSIDTANYGLGQVLMRRERYTIAAEYRHHSCISQHHDYNIYDAIGATLKINLW